MPPGTTYLNPLTVTAQTVYHCVVMNGTRLRSLKTLSSILLLAGFASLNSTAQTRPVPNPQLASKELNQRVDSLLKKMTLEEKIGQLVQFSAGYATGPN